MHRSHYHINPSHNEETFANRLGIAFRWLCNDMTLSEMANRPEQFESRVQVVIIPRNADLSVSCEVHNNVRAGRFESQ